MALMRARRAQYSGLIFSRGSDRTPRGVLLWPPLFVSSPGCTCALCVCVCACGLLAVLLALGMLVVGMVVGVEPLLNAVRGVLR